MRPDASDSQSKIISAAEATSFSRDEVNRTSVRTH